MNQEDGGGNVRLERQVRRDPLGEAFGGYHLIRAHIVAEDPRYPILCINGTFNYGLRINPDTGDISTERLCICGARSEGDCICDL